MVARELTLVKIFFQIVGEQGHTFGYLGRLDSGHTGLAKFDWKVVAQWATKDINLVAQQ